MKRFVLLVALLLGCTVSLAQYPNKPIRFIVGFPPGGSADRRSTETWSPSSAQSAPPT